MTTPTAEPEASAGEPDPVAPPTLTGETEPVRTSTERLAPGTLIAEGPLDFPNDDVTNPTPPAAALLPGMAPPAVRYNDGYGEPVSIVGVAYVALDTETSGLPLYNEEIGGKKVSVGADDPRQPHVAQACMIFLNEHLVELGRFSGYVKPEGWVMEPGATRANGLTTEFLLEHGRPIGEILDVYEQAIKAGAIVCCHNAQFDTKMMRGALRRAGRDDLFGETRNFCTMRKWADHQRSKWPKLEALCQLLGIKQEGQHTAQGDAEAVVNIIQEFRALRIPIEGDVHTSAHHPSRQTA